MTASYVIRNGEDADIERCVALALLAAPERSTDRWRAALLRDIESPEHRLVVAGGSASGRSLDASPSPA